MIADLKETKTEYYNVVLSVWSYMLVKFNCTQQAISEQV